jgi:uncharacterized NAD(P)/FAD-binding protein YdhS
MNATRPSIAVIGAGFSGLMCAIHLLQNSPPQGPRVYLIEERRSFGVGAAYSTESGRHILNTRASNMSVFPDQPDHFLNWLRTRPDDVPPDGAAFVTRRSYGDYLQTLLREIAYSEQAAGRLYLVPDEAQSLAPATKRFALTLRVGKVLTVDAAILATGNPPPHPPGIPDGGFFKSPRYIDDPWDPEAFDRIDPHATILMLGTGLTMVDMVLQLRGKGHDGPLIALSRRGLVPRAHTPQPPGPAIALPSLPERLSQAVGVVRAAVRQTEQQGGSTWRQVIDALRPVTSPYWQSLPLETKQRFLRHLRPWWDVHRHRLAPPVAEQIGRLIGEGALIICRGRLARIAPGDGSDSFPATVSWRPAGDANAYMMGVHYVINCMGPGGDPTRSRSTVIQDMLTSGLARPDPLRLGLDVDPQGRLIGVDGAMSGRLFALGPPTRGVFWECTAVPDIRQYAHRLAKTALDAVERLEV